MFEIIPFGKRNSNLVRNNEIFDVENIFNNFFNDRFFPTLYRNSAQMKVDIKETETGFVLEAELPGIAKEDVNIEVNDENLTISVQRNTQVDEEKDNYVRKERNSSSITRSFDISNIDSENVTAKFQDGILTLNLPKKSDQKKGKHITIE